MTLLRLAFLLLTFSGVSFSAALVLQTSPIAPNELVEILKLGSNISTTGALLVAVVVLWRQSRSKDDLLLKMLERSIAEETALRIKIEENTELLKDVRNAIKGCKRD